MPFQIEGLDPAPFASLFAQTDDQLTKAGIVVVEADDDDYPCRISLAGAAKGDRLLLLNYEHQPAPSPYRSAHAIYIAQGSSKRGVFRDRIPPIMRTRMLSVRSFDPCGMMIAADLADGREAAASIEQLLSDPHAAYLHIHFAKRGCYAATVRRT